MVTDSFTPTVLIIDSGGPAAEESAQLLAGVGCQVQVARGETEGLDLSAAGRFDLVLAGVNSDRDGGWSLIGRLAALDPVRPIVALAQEGDLRAAVEAVKAGAADYLVRPVDPDYLISLMPVPGAEPDRPDLPGRSYRFGRIIGHSPAIERVFKLVDKVADSDSTVLVTGESGTGKELIARAIHSTANDRTGPLVPVNCGAIPEELLESELFGHEKGAFTNAIKTRPGRFELADGGTIFLDEIGEMSPKLQVKLLRVLQEKEFERVGGTRTISVDVRVVAATNQDLYEAVGEGRFREDLYYRLNVIPIHIKPIRQRREDIPLLIDYFLDRFRRKKRTEVEAISDAARQALVDYDWPGNVRELENLIERLVILAEGPVIEPDELPERIRSPRTAGAVAPGQIDELPDQGFSLTDYLAEVENRLIAKALEKANGVKSQAARILDINRTTLVEKMKKKGLL